MPENKSSKSGLKIWRFDQMATNVNVRIDNPSESGMAHYVGLEHLDSDSLKIRRWGTPDDVEATKLMFEKGDIIFGRRRAYQRKLGVADFDGICSAHAMVLRAKPEVVLPEFLPFFMQSDLFMNRAVEISVGSLSPTINWRTMAAQEFAVPPIDAQRKALDRLCAMEDVSAAYRALKSASEKLLHAQLDELLYQSLIRKIYAGEAVQPPAGWRVVALGNVASRITYGFTNPMPTTDTGPWMVTAKDVADGKINFATARHTSVEAYEGLLTDKSRPNIGDVLVTKDGTLGRIGIVEDKNVCINQSVALLQPSSQIRSRFLAWTLRAPTMQWRLLQDAGGSAIKHLYITKIAETKFVLPPIEVQDELLDAIDSSSRASEEIGARQNSLDECRKLLLNSIGGSDGI